MLDGDSLLFGAWRGLAFTSVALNRSFFARNILVDLCRLPEMSDEDLIAMGARRRDLVGKNFSWPRIGEQMRAAYEWVFGGAPPETIRLD